MRLNPKSPPGRSNRKARAFSAEIARLRMDGYGCQAIREALADAGVVVSKSTVQREVARVSCQLPPAAGRGSIGAGHQGSSTSPRSQPTASNLLADEPPSGKDIAERFIKGRITNPLIRARSRDEDSRH
jgi:hypothetical protein